MNLLFDKLEQDGANLLIDKLRTQKVYNWPNYIQPVYRDVESMTYGEFLENFSVLKERFGKVFFKTKKKNINCEVTNVINLKGMNFKAITSENDLDGDNSKDEVFSESAYIVMSDKVKGFNDHRFMFLDKDEEVFVSDEMSESSFLNIPLSFTSRACREFAQSLQVLIRSSRSDALYEA